MNVSKDTANNVLAWLAYRLPPLVFTASRKSSVLAFSFESFKPFQELFLELNCPPDVTQRLIAKEVLRYAKTLLAKIRETVTNHELRQLFTAEEPWIL